MSTKRSRPDIRKSGDRISNTQKSGDRISNTQKSGDRHSDNLKSVDQKSADRHSDNRNAGTQKSSGTKSTMAKFVTLKGVQLTHNTWVNRFVRETGIERHVISNILNYCKLLPRMGSDYIDKNVFTAQLFRTFGISDHALIDCIFQVSKSKIKDVEMNVEDFLRLICIFITDNIRTKAKFVFSVYNHKNSDQSLSTREIYYKLKPVVAYIATSESDDMEEEIIKELVDMSVMFFDHNRDGFVTYYEFEKACIQNPLLLTCLGPCLPVAKNVSEFKTKMTTMTELEILAHFRQERRRCLGYPPSNESNFVQQLYPLQLDLPGNI